MSIVYMYMFMFMYMISFQLVMNSDDWFLLWLGLEINMMTFIMFMYKLNSMLSVESCLKYFFIQGVGSALLMSLFYLKKDWMDLCLLLVLSYKIGAGPFFFWFPSICSGISWFSCFILMSFQKVIPLMLMSFFVSDLLYMIVMISLFFGIFGSFNQKDFKQLIAYSSIYHLGWILLCINTDDIYWMLYLMIYILLIFPVVVFLKWNSMYDMLNIMKIKYKLYLIFMMLSMSGMPPFLGFFLKWFAFMIVFKYEFYFMLYMILCSVVMFYIYFRMIYDNLMVYNEMSIWSNLLIYKKNNYLMVITLISLSMSLFLLMLILF